MKVNKFLKCSKGKPSSKRLAGVALIGLGIGCALILFTISLIGSINDSSTALEVVKTFIMYGSALLGLGVLDNIGSSVMDKYKSYEK